MAQTGDLVIPLFSTSGEKLLKRHPLNDRDEHDSRSRLKASILEHGFRHDVRGGIWAVPGEKLGTGEQSWLLLTGGTIVECLYELSVSDPDDVQVRASLARGIKVSKVYNKRTPKDVLTWLIDGNNRFHTVGTGTSFIKLYQKVQGI